MNSNVKTIGVSTKFVDQFSLGVTPFILVIFILMFYQSGVLLYVVTTVSGCIVVSVLITTSKYYVSYSDGYFIIDHALEKRKLIKSDRYIRVAQSWIDLPFSNTLVIHFRGNEKFRFNGGFHNFRATDLMIRRILTEGSSMALKKNG